MERNKMSAITFIAVILGAVGLSVGAYTLISVQLGAVKGDDGDDGDDGTIGQIGDEGQDGIDGKGAPGGIQVGIIDPDMDDIVSGNISIRTIVFGSNDYTVSVMRNGTEMGTSIPMEWNTTQVTDNWYNITVRVTDVASGNETQDQVLVYVKNTDSSVVHYCSSESEIQEALDTIGNGNGKIIIEQDITISTSIKVDGGGDYIIEGAGMVTIECVGDINVFNITDASSCIITRIKIDVSALTTNTKKIIQIDEIGDNPVYIDNVQILGDSDEKGYGIWANSRNVWITNCYIVQTYYGLYLETGSLYTHIIDNSIIMCGIFGMRINSDHNLVENNFIESCNIRLFGENNIINSNNFIKSGYAIYLDTASNNTITGNNLQNEPNALQMVGIFIIDNSDFNIVSGNLVVGYFRTTAGPASIGIMVRDSDCNENTVVGNTLDNQDNIYNGGTGTHIAENNNP